MEFGNFINKTPSDINYKFRKVESINKKLISNEWSIIFNGVCLKKNILHKYSNFINLRYN